MVHQLRWKVGFLLAIGVGSAAGLLPAVGAERARPARPSSSVSRLATELKPSRKLAYKKVGDRELLLHVFDPIGFRPGDRRPAFIAIHGGGWVGGDAERFYPFAASLDK